MRQYPDLASHVLPRLCIGSSILSVQGKTDCGKSTANATLQHLCCFYEAEDKEREAEKEKQTRQSSSARARTVARPNKTPFRTVLSPFEFLLFPKRCMMR